MPRVFVTTEALRHAEGTYFNLLRAAGLDVAWPQRNVLLTEEECLEELQDCVATLAGSDPYTERVLAGLPQLRIIARNGVGYDRIDLPAATRHGVAVMITPESNHQAVAEHALALVLSVGALDPRHANNIRQGIWRRGNVSIPLRGKTLGIVGLGRIGRSVALRAAAFGMRIIAHEKFPNQQFVAAQQIDLVDLDTLLIQSDFVTLHAPMGAETERMINRHTLARMKRGSYLINTARGGLIDEAALAEALTSGHLAGAGLDVLATEPPPAGHPLLALDNVIVTPHVAAFDTQAIEDMGVAAAQNIVDLLAGKWPANSVVNPDVQAAWNK